MSVSTSPEEVHAQKEISLSDVPRFIRDCFPADQNPSTLITYMQYVTNLGFETRPDYNFLRSLFSRSAWKNDGSLLASQLPATLKKSQKRTSDENISCAAPVKRLCVKNSTRKPCVPVNCEVSKRSTIFPREFRLIIFVFQMRMTRKNQPTNPKAQFSWEEVLARHPDKMAKLHPVEAPLEPPLTPPPSPTPPALPTYAMLQVIQRIKDKQSGVIKSRSSFRTME